MENISFEEIYDRDICKEAGSFEDEIDITNKEEDEEVNIVEVTL